MVKDDVRLASLLGTWTGQSHIKMFSVGHYELLVYFILHLMPDPMRGYGCRSVLPPTPPPPQGQQRQPLSSSSSSSSCREIDNQVCIEHDTDQEITQECVNMTEHINQTIPWSDVTAFLFFGARVDAGLPFNVHLEHNTSGWIGPFNLILAQQQDEDNNNNNNHNNTTSDAYVARYVSTPSTPYLQMQKGCTLFRQEDFEQYMGATAVRETVLSQTRVAHGDDPYAAYLGTCDHGNVKPILPLYQFVFTPQKQQQQKQQQSSSASFESDNNYYYENNKTEDLLQIKLDYKIMTMPHPKDVAYKVMPDLQKLFNRQKNGEFHISGPYCYGDDPNRGWTFDFSYDSQKESKYMTLVHGCVEGLPCTPPAATLETLAEHGGTIIYNHTAAGEPTANLGLDTMVMAVFCYVTLIALLISITCNCQQSLQVKRLKQQQHHHHHDSHDDDDQDHRNNNNHARSNGDVFLTNNNNTNLDELGESDLLLEPLLSDGSVNNNNNKDCLDQGNSTTTTPTTTTPTPTCADDKAGCCAAVATNGRRQALTPTAITDVEDVQQPQAVTVDTFVV